MARSAPKLIRCNPTVKSYYGGDVVLTKIDMQRIEDLVAIGAGLDMVATELNLDLSDFKRIGKVSTLIQAAVKRGRAKDRWEYDQALRAASLSMKSPILAIWHGKQAFNLQDKVTPSNQSNSVVIVNTGVPQPIEANNQPLKQPIDHE